MIEMRVIYLEKSRKEDVKTNLETYNFLIILLLLLLLLPV